MANFLDYDGLLYFYQKLKTKFNKVDPATTTPVMDGTAATGSSENYARADHVHPTDTSRAPTSHASTGTTYGKGNADNYGHVRLTDTYGPDTSDANSGYATTPKAVQKAYDDAVSFAESIAKAFGRIKVGTTNVDAESDFDTLELVAGSNVTLTPDATNDKITIAANGIPHATCSTAAGTAAKVATLDNSQSLTLAAGAVVTVTFEHGNSATTPTLNVNSTGAKNIVIPSSATAQTTGSGTTYNSWGAYETLLFTYNGSQWVHMGSGYLQYQAFNKANAAAPKTSPALTGTPTAPTAAAGTNSTQIATTAFVTTAIANATAGAVAFKGTLGSSTSTATYTQDTLEASDYEAGWYWVVNAGGTYVGKNCGVGDMVYAIAAKGSAYSASDFTVVQNEMDAITNAQIDTITAS